MARKDWIYTGDMDLANGGTFYQLPDETPTSAANIRVVEVTPVAQAVGGPDSVFLIESGYTYLSRDKWKKALDCCGWTLETINGVEGIAIGFGDWHGLDTAAGVALLLQAAQAYSGIEDPDREVVQIGKTTEYDPDYTMVPDVVVRGNWKLKNYVAKNWL